MPQLAQEYYKPAQLQVVLGLSRKTIRKLIDDGTIPFAWVGGTKLVHKDWLRKAIEMRRADAPSGVDLEAERILKEMTGE